MEIDVSSAGLSNKQLNRITDHLTRRYIEPGKIAGALPIVFRKGHVAYCQPLGFMDLERQKPMQEDTIFRIYSMSKPITSVAFMQLYEQGMFQLNDPVSRFIPEWKNLRVYASGVVPNFLTTPCEQEMRIRDLLMHTSGLTYGFMNRTNVDHAYRRLKVAGEEPGATLQDMIDKMATLPLEFSPGTQWNYSHATDVIGFLIERLSGLTLNDYLQANIFDPLGMTDTGFTVKDVSRFAANYTRGADKKLMLQDDPETSIYTKPRTFLGGGGGLVSTASDYLSFCRCLLAGGELNGQRIIGEKTLVMMTSNHLPNDDDLTKWATGAFSEIANEGYGFGLGFSIHLGSERSATIGSKGDYAWGGAASTIFWVDPQEELIVIFMTQFMPSGTFNFRGQMKSLVYPAIVS